MSSERKGAEIMLKYMCIHGQNIPLVQESALAAVDLILNALTNINEIDDEHEVIKECTAAKKYIKNYGKDK